MAHLENIAQHGWTMAALPLPPDELVEYARLSNVVLGLALEDEQLRQALTFNVSPEQITGTVDPGLFGVFGARNSADRKRWLHLGYQSRLKVAGHITEYNQPQELRVLWPLLVDMLAGIQESFRLALAAIGAEAVSDIIFASDWAKRNVHIRTVRYLGEGAAAGDEAVAGHADLGLCSLHVYETHKGWLRGARYYTRQIRGEDNDARRSGIRKLRQRLAPLDVGDEEAIFFLGTGWHGLPKGTMTTSAARLPALYHAGFRPDSGQEALSPSAEVVTAGSGDRVAVVVFAQPNIEFATSGKFVLPTLNMCRPQYVA